MLLRFLIGHMWDQDQLRGADQQQMESPGERQNSW
jgi:hypothetical protein